MRTRPLVLALLLIASRAAQPQNRDSVVAFIGGSVLSMRSPSIARDQTVLVRDGVIAAVGPVDRVAIPAGARRMDARGKYLMPGLADFHVHLAERTDLALYLASGVTTVGYMGGIAAPVLAWRDSIRARQLVGPRIYVGYYMNGPASEGGVRTIETTAEARDGVASASRRGFDFVKVYNSLTEEQYLAIVGEAKRLRLPVMGHAVRSIGLERGFGLGQVAVVHAEEYMYADLRRRRDSASVASAIAFTRRADATLIPNLSAFEAITQQWGRPAQLDSFLAKPEASTLSPFWRAHWKSRDYVARPGTLTALPFLKTLTLAMQRGGVRLLLGTDSPSIPGVFPGASVHEELRLLVEAGLTPYEALVAGTRAAGEFAAEHLRAGPSGVIAVGYRADIVMLGGNPLEDLRHARRPVGVMANGTIVVR